LFIMGQHPWYLDAVCGHYFEVWALYGWANYKKVAKTLEPC
jgi:hypothetical protein